MQTHTNFNKDLVDSEADLLDRFLVYTNVFTHSYKPLPERRVIARIHLSTPVNALRRAIYHIPKHI